VIVESPAKARTVGRFLGKGYTVKASIGHVRDLLRSQMSVDVEHDFEPKYRVPKRKTAVVKEIKPWRRHTRRFTWQRPRREGEAISWHLLQAANIPLNTPSAWFFTRSPSQPLPKPSGIRATLTWPW